jgi:hypothetical protein
MARLGRSASAKPQLCSRTLLHLLRHFGTVMPSMMTQGKIVLLATTDEVVE